MSDSLQPHELSTRLLHAWDSPGKSTEAGSHSLLQRIFPTQRSNAVLPHWGQSLYHLSYQGSTEQTLGNWALLSGLRGPLAQLPEADHAASGHRPRPDVELEQESRGIHMHVHGAFTVWIEHGVDEQRGGLLPRSLFVYLYGSHKCPHKPKISHLPSTLQMVQVWARNPS